MMSSKSLKLFVKAHERKLNAKMSGLVAGQHELNIQDTHAISADHFGTAAAGHWNLRETGVEARRRPKSRYFDFILTSTHQ